MINKSCVGNQGNAAFSYNRPVQTRNRISSMTKLTPAMG
jgi:hypothetical protein